MLLLRCQSKVVRYTRPTMMIRTLNIASVFFLSL